jgi:hypothetical protein
MLIYKCKATIFIAAEPTLICKNIISHNKTEIISDYDETCKIWSTLIENDTDKQNFNKIKKSNNTECYFDKTFYDVCIYI